MSSSSGAGRRGLLALLLCCALSLSGCSSFRPVYGDNGVAPDRIELAYAKPASRLDQIIYQELALRFGRAYSSDAPRLQVLTSVAARGVTRTSIAKPQTQYQILVTSTATLARADGEVIFTGSRSAAANYVAVGQVLADTEAINEAQERAAREVAEGLRLAILGALATPAAQQ